MKKTFTKMGTIIVLIVLLLNIFIPVISQAVDVVKTVDGKTTIAFNDKQLADKVIAQLKKEEISITTGSDQASGATLVTLEYSDLIKISDLDLSTEDGKERTVINDLTGLRAFTGLTHLRLDNCDLSECGLSELEYLKDTIWSLSLDNTNISSISTISKLTKLRNLSIEANKITNLDDLKVLTGLKKLYLDGNKNLTDLSALKDLTNIIVLSARSCKITDDTLKNLQKLPLTDLRLDYDINLTYAGIGNIYSSTNKDTLEILSLVGIEGISRPNEIVKFEKLQKLYIRRYWT